nr:hypothetical protein [Tanacetum cinerariifolium]
MDEVRGEIGITTFRNALKIHYLPHSTMYVLPPFITIVRPWFAIIGYTVKITVKGTLKKSCLHPRWRFLMAQILQCLGGKTGGLDQISNKDATILYYLANWVQVDYAKIIWDDLIHKINKKTREKIVLYPSVHNLTLKPNQPEEPPFTNHMKAICNLVVPMDSKAPKPSSQPKKVPQGKKPRATTRLKSKRSLKHTSESKIEASKSQTGQSKIETQFGSAKDKSLSHPSPPTPVVGEMHKEAQQTAGGPTSLGSTSKEGAHPQLSSGHDVSIDSTAKANPGPSAPNDSIPPQQGMDEGTKNTPYDHIFAGSNPNVLVDKTKSARDGLKTVNTESGANTRSAFFTLDSPPDEPVNVSDESDQEEVEKAKETPATSQDVPKDILKKDLEQLKAPTEAEVASLKAKPSYSDINQLTTLLVTELKNIQWELPAEFLDLPHLESLVQEKLKTLDSLLGLLKMVTNTLNKFATLVKNASEAITMGVPSADKATASHAEGEKDADTNLKNEIMKKRRQSFKIINCDVLTKNGPISLKEKIIGFSSWALQSFSRFKHKIPKVTQAEAVQFEMLKFLQHQLFRRFTRQEKDCFMPKRIKQSLLEKAVEVPQTLEYMGGQLNASPVLEVKFFTDWKKWFMCHIIGIEPQFENIIKNDSFAPMIAGQRKPENQWTGDERKAANLDQRLKSLIMTVLPDDQCLCV